MGCVASTAEKDGYESSDNMEVLGASRPQSNSMSYSVESADNDHPASALVRHPDKSVHYYENGRDIGWASLTPEDQKSMQIWELADYERKFGVRKHLKSKDDGQGKIYQRPDGSYGFLDANGKDGGTVTAFEGPNGRMLPAAGQTHLKGVPRNAGQRYIDANGVPSEAPTEISVHPPSVNGNTVVEPNGQVIRVAPMTIVNEVGHVIGNAGAPSMAQAPPQAMRTNQPLPSINEQYAGAPMTQPIRLAQPRPVAMMNGPNNNPMQGTQGAPLAIMYQQQSDNRSVVSDQSSNFPRNLQTGEFDNRSVASGQNAARVGFDGKGNYQIPRRPMGQPMVATAPCQNKMASIRQVTAVPCAPCQAAKQTGAMPMRQMV